MFTGKRKKQRGFAMILAMIICAIAATVMYRSLSRSNVTSHTVTASQDRTTNYLLAEDAFHKALTWMRSNSTGLAMQFSRNNYYTNFTRAAAPSSGTNDISPIPLPSRVKSYGANTTVLLSNSTSLGTSAFPSGIDTVTGATFNPVSSFAAQSFGSQLVKISLLDAPPYDPTKDYGAPPSTAPATDFTPIYRIDAMNAIDRGAHVFGIVAGSLVLDNGMGFYGRDVLELRQSCDSYISNNGTYSTTSKRANCTAGSNATAQIHQTTNHYGTLKTNGTINSTSPFGGKVCSDFVSGCPNPGLTCQGSSCAVPGLPTYSPWTTYCPTNAGNVTISSSTSLTAGATPATNCWNSVTVNNNKVLTLTSTTNSYFIDTLNIANNSVVAFNPSPATATINLYVRTITGDKFNGNQIFNTSNKPYQLRLHYLGTNPLTLNGTSQMNAFIVAPYAPVTVSGNFTYQGGIKATSLYATGSGALHYDESGDITTISDMTYRIKSLQQYIR